MELLELKSKIIKTKISLEGLNHWFELAGKKFFSKLYDSSVEVI